MDANTALLVQQWQQSTSNPTRPTETGIVGRLYEACESFYSHFLPLVKGADSAFSRRQYNSLERAFHTLRLWAEGYGVAEGELDNIMEQSKSLQQTTLSLLSSIGKVLSQKLINIIKSDEDRDKVLERSSLVILLDETRSALSGRHREEPESESDDSDVEDLDNGIDEAVADLKLFTQCLVDLGPSIECPALDPGVDEDIAYIAEMPLIDDRSAYQYYVDVIRSKYPQADADVSDFLGKVNWERYTSLQNRRLRNFDREDVEAHMAEDRAKSEATGSKFHDSGVGSSLGPKSAYAESMASFNSTRAEGSRTRIPPLPAEAKAGLPFSCSACGEIISIRKTKDWRKHLFADLKPYVCLHLDCKSVPQTFETRIAWVNHMTPEHDFFQSLSNQLCALCGEQINQGLQRHFSRHLEDIALAALPRGFDSELNSEASSEASEDLDASSALLKSVDDDASIRSIARRKKNPPPVEPEICSECGREFKRRCDLVRHEKIHSRPFKCSEPNCKYHEYGWPTEKERDRHFNDKHGSAPVMYKCIYHPCTYQSKRESNCKQHMEKAHGWTYSRSKNNGKRVQNQRNLEFATWSASMATPSTANTDQTEHLSKNDTSIQLCNEGFSKAPLDSDFHPSHSIQADTQATHYNVFDPNFNAFDPDYSVFDPDYSVFDP